MTNTNPYAELSAQILDDIAGGRCVSITGLSNTGKSTLMRSLANADFAARYAQLHQRPVNLVYIDCNRAVALSARAFFEVVLRSVLEGRQDDWPADLLDSLRNHYAEITEAEDTFRASLAFNNALAELCERVPIDLCLLVDEFDEIYGVLEDRTLLNLRALRDRFSAVMTFVTATVRSLPRLRARDVEGEFAELFSRSSYSMPLLTEAQAGAMIEALDPAGLSDTERKACVSLAGGHPGLLLAAVQALTSAAAVSESRDHSAEEVLQRAPGMRSECLKIWGQLMENEQAGLISLVLDPESGLAPQQMEMLERNALVRAKQVFSPIFADFVGKRGRGHGVSAEGVHLDADAGDVWVDGARIAVLTDLEFRLLELLYERIDKITDKYRIVTGVWGEEYLGEVDDARVEKLVSRLRNKIEADPASPRYLITQRGRGYKLQSRAQVE